MTEPYPQQLEKLFTETNQKLLELRQQLLDNIDELDPIKEARLKQQIEKVKGQRDELEAELAKLKDTPSIISEIDEEEYTRSKQLQKIIAALGDKNIITRYKATQDLGNARDKRAIQPLLNTLKDANYGVRASAAWALGNIGDKQAVAALITALSDKNDTVRSAAATALGEIGDSRALAALEALQHKPRGFADVLLLKTDQKAANAAIAKIKTQE